MHRTLSRALALLLLLVLAGCGDTAGGPADTGSHVSADAGGDNDDSDAGITTVAPPSLSLTYSPPGLTSMARAAVLVAPAWLQDDLAINLARIEANQQDVLSGLLFDLELSPLVDEVAFTIAHTSPEVINQHAFFADLCEVNATLIYEYDADLDYVELTEVGVPGEDTDFYTTLTYRIENDEGVLDELTIDRELYYWFVVHPRLEDEIPLFVDGWESSNGTSPTQGWLWRDFLWEAAAEQCPADRECPLLKDTQSDVQVFHRGGDDSSFENDAIGQVWAFVGQALHWGAGNERPIQPNRIYAVACGNCGEYADFFVAAARTSLIPARNTGASSNDHTWGEWWWEGEGWQGEMGKYKGGVGRNLTDSNCDGQADDGIDEEDHDGDGVTVAAGDCDDNDDAVHPDATEIQNGYDDDCDGTADTGFDDADLDGDGDGWSIAAGDCDDFDDTVHPEATEEEDGRDNDCDGTADDGSNTDDADADGVTIADGDCDDNAGAIFPGAEEVANGRDDNCDGVADEGMAAHDRDRDGFTLAAGDCDDLDAGRHPDRQDPSLSNNRLYAITISRGDSYQITDRTEAYATLPSYLELQVTDTDGDPVDGAMVTIYGTWAVYGEPDLWAVASEIITDLNGHASITVGEYNPYGFSVSSALGDNPPGDSLYRAVERTAPWDTYVIPTDVPGVMPAGPEVTEADLVDGAAAEVSLEIGLAVDSYRIAGDGKLFGSFSLARDGGSLDLFVFDADGYQSFAANEPVNAQAIVRDVTETTYTVDLPRDRSWVIVLSNAGSLASTMVGSITVAATPPEDIAWSGDQPIVEERFRIPPAEHVAATLEP